MCKDVEFIKYCCKHAVSFTWDKQIKKPLFLIKGYLGIGMHEQEWIDGWFKLLISQTCDALGVDMLYFYEGDKWSWSREPENSTFVGWSQYDTADEARIAAIKKYMEVEG